MQIEKYSLFSGKVINKLTALIIFNNTLTSQ